MTQQGVIIKTSPGGTFVTVSVEGHDHKVVVERSTIDMFPASWEKRIAKAAKRVMKLAREIDKLNAEVAA